MTNNIQKYTAYKPSGVEWLGEIPEHWEVKKLKYFFLEEESLFIDGDWIESKDIRGDEVKYITTGNIGEGFYKEQGEGFITLETFKKLNCTGVKENDILISRLNVPLGRCCLCPKFEKKLIVSVDVAICRMDNNYVRKYFVYVMNSPFYQDFSEIESRGAIMKRISRTILGNFQLPIPPLTEQTRIAEFLDRKTTQIDQAIGIKEKQIALLKERRQLMIHRAVTRGISGLNWDSSDLGISGLASESNIPKSANQVNPDSDIYHRNQPKLKPSGVEWIGDIPEHWIVSKMGNYATVNNGTTPSRDIERYWNDGNIAWVASGKVNDLIINEPSEYITQKALRECSLKIFPIGTILLGIVGQGKTRGTSALLNIPATINQNLAGIVPDEKLDSKFLHNFLIISYSEVRRGNGSNQEALNCQLVSSFKILIPPIEEQKQIVTYIEVLSSKIATAISLKEQEIAKLKEYKSVLINSAVTGKVKVG